MEKLPDQFCCERSTDMYFEHSKNDSVDCTSVFQSFNLETVEGARALPSLLFLEKFRDLTKIAIKKGVDMFSKR